MITQKDKLTRKGLPEEKQPIDVPTNPKRQEEDFVFAAESDEDVDLSRVKQEEDDDDDSDDSVDEDEMKLEEPMPKRNRNTRVLPRGGEQGAAATLRASNYDSKPRSIN